MTIYEKEPWSISGLLLGKEIEVLDPADPNLSIGPSFLRVSESDIEACSDTHKN